MRIIGCDLQARQQTLAMLDTETGEVVHLTLMPTIRAEEPRKQKHDRRDAELILKQLAENRFPAIWLATKELLDLRASALHRHQWVRIRTRIQNALQAIALANGLRRGPGLWSYEGQAKIAPRVNLLSATGCTTEAYSCIYFPNVVVK